MGVIPAGTAARSTVEGARAVNNDDAPPLLCRRKPEEPGNRAGVFDHDVAAQPSAPRIIGALDGEQIGMAARCNPPEDAALGINRQPLYAAWRTKQKAGKPESKRSLADTARPAYQDRVRQPPRFDEPAQLALGSLVAEERRVRPRREHASRIVNRCLYRHNSPAVSCRMGCASETHPTKIPCRIT